MVLRCDAVIVHCMDFRLVPYLRRFTETELAGKTFDEISYAGATRDLAVIMQQIDLVERLHEPKQVVLIHHEDCGAYGAESTPERHAADLRRAREAVLARHPGVQVDLYYLRLDGSFERVS